ncbi:hypothetical protein G6W57_04785 [Streptomyces sp. CAI-121]|uniref:hypothetical protein n=1 Tax=unclassified Streptomyces TaxID=2593676 RepID=UPI001587CAEE|nr:MULTISPECIES: hypothetical protein [unclassified Streptomyces]NUV66428.1 hypothetical protein [Streptomyces sp. CAI-121]NUW11890.1 hypothetical protein [Streptomyces sp. CAI-68]
MTNETVCQWRRVEMLNGATTGGKMRRAWWAAAVWVVLSGLWVVGVTWQEELARDPASWTGLCLGVAAMVATLLVFVVTLAPMLVQMHFRHTAGLAVAAIDWRAVAFGVFFIAGAVLPVLAAALPSRTATVAVIAGAMPVIGSLVPAVLFFTARLKVDWLLRRRVHRATARLSRHRRGRRRPRYEWDAIRELQDASGAVRLVMKHAGESWSDQSAGLDGGIQLLASATAADTVGTRDYVVKELRAYAWLGAELGTASALRNAAFVLESAAKKARPATGRHIVTAALDGLRSMAERSHVGPAERADLAATAARMTFHSLERTAKTVEMHDVMRRRPTKGAGKAAGQEGVPKLPTHEPFMFRSERLEHWQVLEAGTGAIEELIGLPGRPLDDGRTAELQARAFSRGCHLLSDLAECLLERGCWVEYDRIIGCLDGWLRHRMGAGPDRVDDLTPKGPQPFPYARELEAAAEALADIAVAAYGKGFDHVARAALAVLVLHCECALRQDRTAFVLCARALTRCRSELFTRPATPLGLADRTRAAELITELQTENRMLLTTLARLVNPEELTAGDSGHRQGAAWREAVLDMQRWALRPVPCDLEGYGQLALEIARTAQEVRRPDGWTFLQPLRGEELSDAEERLLRREAMAFQDHHPFELNADFRVALVQAFWSDGGEPGLEVFRASVRWGAALEAVRRGVADDPGEVLRDLAGGRRYGPGGSGVSAEAAAFGDRIAAWAGSPWCLTSTSPSDYRIPTADDLLHLPRAHDDEVTRLPLLVRRFQESRQRRIVSSEFAEVPQRELQAAEILWGTYPPPPGCPRDPWREAQWAADRLIADRLREFRAEHARGWISDIYRRTDRTYQARRSGVDRIVVAEPDGSIRVLRAVATAREPFLLRYGSAEEEILTRRLAADALGPLGMCPACHGGTTSDWTAGWCPTCRGMRRHPDFARAQGAVSRAVATAEAEQGIEWDLTRSELLDAISASASTSAV